MSKPFLYENTKHIKDSNSAVIVLPEIFGVTHGIKEITDRFADEFKTAAFALDFFYPLTGEPNSFDYETEGQKGFELMKKLSAEDFNKLFEEAIDYIVKAYPEIEEFTVVGFCFGGRLAYLSGLNKKVTKIISFYGGNANAPYFNEKSVTEALAEARKDDDELQVLALFGSEDQSIPDEEIKKTIATLTDDDVNFEFEAVVLEDAGHAFFNHKRKNYHQPSAEKAWAKVTTFLE
jgi:carboxymethylenebutenolidase